MPPILWKKPAWVDPEQASVTDPWYVKTARLVGQLIGVDDPASQVMGLVGTVEVPAAKGADVVTDLLKRIAAEPEGTRAYHGSPHTFEKFDLSKIGTGEGTQAFGPGLYFAEHPEVARSYRPKPEGVPDPAQDVANYWRGQAGGDMEKAIQLFENYARASELSPSEMAPIREAIEGGGRMYEVNIRAHPEELLDWDKPFSQQSETVREALRPYGFKPETTVEQILDQLSVPRTTSGNQMAAAQALKERGIKGTRYLDRASREAGEGTRNYSIWDESIIDLLRRYGLAGVATGGGAAAASQAEQ